MANHRKSYFLSVTPVDYSLTEGTNIPPPAETETETETTPARSPSPLEPPTPGGGPLTSHPATPPESTYAEPTMTRTHLDGSSSGPPPSPPQLSSSSPPTHHRPNRVRKLLSLTNLRSSFSSSRTSLSLSHPRPSHEISHPHPALKRPASPGAASSLAPSTIATISAAAPLRPRKSASWFRRKSQLFLLNGDLESVDEAETRTREPKRFRDRSASPAPLLPEIGALPSGGGMTGGDLGWDEHVFEREVVT